MVGTLSALPCLQEVGMQDYEQNIEIRKEALFALIPKGSKVMELGIGCVQSAHAHGNLEPCSYS